MSSVGLVVLLLAVAAALAVVARRINVPHPVLLVLGGGVLAFMPKLPTITVAPDTLFLVFIPPLLYWAAVNTSLRDFREAFRSITLLAVGLVLVTMVAVAVVARTVAPDTFTWAAAFTLGAIIAPPDPVAALAVTRRLGIPSSTLTILEGEGLVNDATALVAYRMAVAAAVTGHFSASSAAWHFLLTGAGGVAVGLAAGWGVELLRRSIESTPDVTNTISLLTPYAAYLPAERLGLSGVLAVVAIGLYLGRRGSYFTAPPTRLQGQALWRVVTFVLESLVFILVGLELRQIRGALHGWPLGPVVRLAAVVTLTLVVVRAVWMFPGAYLPRLVDRWRGRTVRFPSWRQVAFVAWTGLRGGDSLVIALAIPTVTGAGTPFPARPLIVALTFAVILATLVLQGLTVAPLARLLRLRPDRRAEEEESRARVAAARAGLARLTELQRASGTDSAVANAVRFLRDQTRHRLALEQEAASRDGGTGDAHHETETYQRLRSEMMAAERRAILGLRDEGAIGDDAMRAVERDLDLESLLLDLESEDTDEEGDVGEEPGKDEAEGAADRDPGRRTDPDAGPERT